MGMFTKLVPGTTPGTYVEVEGNFLDLINPLVRPADTEGSIAKLVVTAVIVKLLS